MCVLSCFSHVQLFATLWTIACKLLWPKDSPGKNTGVGCHFLLQKIFPTQGLNSHLFMSPALAQGSLPLVIRGKPKRKVLAIQSCLPVCNPVDYSLPDSSVHSILQTVIREPLHSRGDLPNSGIEPESPTLRVDSLLSEPPGKPCLVFFIYNPWKMKSPLLVIWISKTKQNNNNNNDNEKTGQ